MCYDQKGGLEEGWREKQVIISTVREVPQSHHVAMLSGNSPRKDIKKCMPGARERAWR